MAAFFEGSRGSGKSKYSVERMQNRLKSGRAVATNLDLFLDELWPENPKAHYTRLPDFPRSSDLLLLGKAYPELDYDDPTTYDDKKFGCVVLDELLTSFNSRNWNDPDRIEVVNWIVQSRKHGWDLCLIGQSIDAIDKQIKETVIDELYSFRSSLNLFPGLFWKMLIAPWFNKLVPKFHMCTKYDGRKKDKKQKIGGDHFRRNDLHKCYKTGQQFKKDVKIVVSDNGKKPKEIDLRATYTVLHPHYFGAPKQDEFKKVAGTKEEPKKIVKQDSSIMLFGILLFAFCGYYFINNWSTQQQAM
ncbi:zonular occludens toxin domain-containing protein, partial [Thalassotalea sp. PLHSN55]|uniref:zonular occludens toxin domain-containing protein n=1 Tax=Thalassotalea sp. PLHSN55 TaxID=3435888 RepID=UPI003F86C7A9